jgi:uroporphyrinogen decarboxylase
LLPFDSGGLEYLRRGEWDVPIGLHCGSLYGVIRNWLGLVGSAYLLVDDETLFDEIIGTVGELCYQCTKVALESGAQFDFAHFWEDISFKSGPLINPAVFRAKVGPYYRRITDLVHSHGIDVISLDSDGKIDDLIPVWFDNGVNTMFPIEVGTWHANIKPWRDTYGRGLLGVGGMNKKILAYDYGAVDEEVKRLKPLVELGGYIPCPDHRIPPDAKWENVQYYCEQMRKVFG